MYKRGTQVDFKGNDHYRALSGTYVWAINEHEITTYYIQHPDGHITKESMENSRMGDGFEQPHSMYFDEDVKYIIVLPDEISLHKNNESK